MDTERHQVWNLRDSDGDIAEIRVGSSNTITEYVPARVDERDLGLLQDHQNAVM